MDAGKGWPALATPGWEESCATLHLWAQVVGKTRLALEPAVNHWWHVPLYVTARGLGTGVMSYGELRFDVELDLVDGWLHARTSEEREAGFPLDAPTVADFHRRYMDALARMGVHVHIDPLAVEIPETVYLDRDRVPRRYDPAWGQRFFGALARADHLLKEFRGGFLGKASPVHFFWGSFDLAVSRFSGRRAPRHPGGVPHCPSFVMEEAYSHEVSSAGFWPGGGAYPEAAFYSYVYPEPAGFRDAPVLPPPARYLEAAGEFILPYEAVRRAASPELDVRTFLQTTYVAAAELAGWDRATLERAPACAGAPAVTAPAAP